MKKSLEDQLLETERLVDQISAQSEQMYAQVNRLLFWKSALKVRVNKLCPDKTLIGKTGYISDVFPDGFTVYIPKSNQNIEHDFLRLPAEYLDVVAWDKKQFKLNMKKLGLIHVNGQWITKKD